MENNAVVMGEKQDDQDYVISSDNGSEGGLGDQAQPEPRSKAKFKPQRKPQPKVSFFFHIISELRECVVHSEAISGLQ